MRRKWTNPWLNSVAYPHSDKLDHYDRMQLADYRTLAGLKDLSEAQYLRALARPGAMSPSALRKEIARTDGGVNK